MAKVLFLSAKVESPVVVVPSKYVLMTTEQILTARPIQHTLPSRCIRELYTNVPFWDLVINISIQPMATHKPPCIDIGTVKLVCTAAANETTERTDDGVEQLILQAEKETADANRELYQGDNRTCRSKDGLFGKRC